MRLPRPLFLGNETSQNPAVRDLVSAAKALSNAGVGLGAVSARHGLRATINAGGVSFSGLTPAHFVEVADYDPHADTVMCLGPSPPTEHAALHMLVYRAKKEVGAIVQADIPPDHAVHARLPQVKLGRTVLETAMTLLEALRTADAVSLGGHFVWVTAPTIDAARAETLKRLAG